MTKASGMSVQVGLPSCFESAYMASAGVCPGHRCFFRLSTDVHNSVDSRVSSGGGILEGTLSRGECTFCPPDRYRPRQCAEGHIPGRVYGTCGVPREVSRETSYPAEHNGKLIASVASSPALLCHVKQRNTERRQRGGSSSRRHSSSWATRVGEAAGWRTSVSREAGLTWRMETARMC